MVAAVGPVLWHPRVFYGDPCRCGWCAVSGQCFPATRLWSGVAGECCGSAGCGGDGWWLLGVRLRVGCLRRGRSRGSRLGLAGGRSGVRCVCCPCRLVRLPISTWVVRTGSMLTIRVAQRTPPYVISCVVSRIHVVWWRFVVCARPSVSPPVARLGTVRLVKPNLPIPQKHHQR
jgi:hypothetical protein